MTEKMKALKAEVRIRQRRYNEALRALERVKGELDYQEQRYELARAKQKSK